MVTSAAYDKMVADGLAKRAEIRGNLSSKTMTEAETQAEIAKVYDGAKSGEFPIKPSLNYPKGATAKYEIDRNTVNVTMPWPEPGKSIIDIPPEIQPTGYVTKSGRVYKSKPGRKPKDSGPKSSG